MEGVGIEVLLEVQQDISIKSSGGEPGRRQLCGTNISSWRLKQPVCMTPELAGDAPGCKLQETVHTATCTHASRISGMQPACILCNLCSLFPSSAHHCESWSHIFVPTQLPATTQKEGQMKDKITYLGFSTG